jgi:hypothetical protein
VWVSGWVGGWDLRARNGNPLLWRLQQPLLASCETTTAETIKRLIDSGSAMLSQGMMDLACCMHLWAARGWRQ